MVDSDIFLSPYVVKYYVHIGSPTVMEPQMSYPKTESQAGYPDLLGLSSYI
jgi:hypothetical protein